MFEGLLAREPVYANRPLPEDSDTLDPQTHHESDL
jgi:hypothetical protein